MNELSEILKTATQNIDLKYFRIKIDGGDPIYRERVYCYELYHQMRRIWPINCPYFLNGELDKAAHPILHRLGADLNKPDLLVHRPGNMKYNHAIIEVKPSQPRFTGIVKDLETLSLFIKEVKYERAIYLLYGYEANIKLVERIQDISLNIKNLAPIELWLHPTEGQPAFHNITLGVN